MRNVTLALTSIFWVASIATSPLVSAAEPVAKVTHLSGLLTAKRADGSKKIISAKSDIMQGDTLSTEKDTYARMKFADGSEVVLRPGTQMEIKEFSFSQEKPEADSVVMNLFKGGFRAVTGLLGKRSRDSVHFTTATATIGIRGTHFGMLVCNNDCGGVQTGTSRPPPNGLHLDVADGAVTVSNRATSAPGGQPLVVSSGQFGYVANADSAPQRVAPAQGVIVSMPEAISRNKTESRGVSKSDKDGC